MPPSRPLVLPEFLSRRGQGDVCRMLPAPTSSPPYGLYPSCPCVRASECLLSRFSCIHLFVTPWTVVHQASLSMGFSRQEYWSGLPFLSPGALPHPGVELTSLTSPAELWNSGLLRFCVFQVYQGMQAPSLGCSCVNGWNPDMSGLWH